VIHAVYGGLESTGPAEDCVSNARMDTDMDMDGQEGGFLE
jgi:hypothetical protein